MRAIVLLLFFSFNCLGQSRERVVLDSLLAELSSGKYKNSYDTGKVKLLGDIAAAYYMINHDSMAIYAKEGLSLSMQLNYKYGEAICWAQLAQANYDNFNEALEYCHKALKIFEQVNDENNMALTLRKIGGLYFNMEKFPEALNYFDRALSYFEKTHDRKGVAGMHHSIAAVYINMDKFSTALEHQLLALKYFEEINNTRNIAMANSNIGNCYVGLKEYNKALLHSSRAVRMFGALRVNDYGYATVLSERGYIHYRIATDSTSVIQPDSLLPEGRSANLAKAIQYYNEAYSVYLKSPDFSPATILERLSAAMEATGRYKEALQLYKQADKISDSLLSEDTRLKVSAQETRREMDLKDRQIELNRIQEKQKKAERNFYVASILILFVVTGIVTRNFVKQKRTNALLEKEKIKSNELLIQKDSLLGQKDLLMKEIHHRVKNNLQVINTLLELQLDTITDENAQKAIREGMGRIKSISLTHHQLYHDEHINTIEFSRFAKDLESQVTAVFKKNGQQVAFNNSIPEIYLDVDTAMPLGLMLNELLTNSFKYAFNGAVNCGINVTIDKVDSQYRLVYSDTGPGLPENFEILKSGRLGMIILVNLSKQLKGSFNYNSKNKQFIILFCDITTRKKTS
ncbi:MAG: hypothetical protein K0Q79_527 [Flavipsychrobacter sp.]|jgi:two-component sensor histidine kinase|nr:hypothetical protein [Flavipsychrobacter sp.]